MPPEKKDKIRINAPFEELFFAHTRILDIAKAQEANTEKERHLNVLVKLMDELFTELSPMVAEQYAQEIVTCGTIWTMFPKGMIAYSQHDNQDRLYQVTGTHFKPGKVPLHGFWYIECQFVQFDGNSYGMTRKEIAIPEFHGVKKISSLPIYPLGFHSDTTLEKQLEKRGQLVLRFQGTDYQEYAGTAKAADEDDEDEHDWQGEMKKYHVCNGRGSTDNN